jgi:hypothetical protein
MKLIMTAIATLGAMTTFAGSALADVSINIRFGSSPSTNTYRTYDSYRSNTHQPVYYNPYYRNHRNYDHQHNVNSRVIVREIVPSHNYGNSWNYPTAPSVVYPAVNQSVYNPYNVNLGGYGYIVEQRLIRVR